MSKPSSVPFVDVWLALGYSEKDAAALEIIVADLMKQPGGPHAPETIRRAIAAVTFQPTAPEKGLLASIRLKRRLRRAILGRLLPT